MKLIITAKGNQWDSLVDDRFGRAELFAVVDDKEQIIKKLSNEEARSGAHGAGPKAAQVVAAENANVLITGNGPGGNAALLLEKAGIEVYCGAGGMTIQEAIEAFNKKRLKKVL